jgi:uncharacterized LabA/DUF88 family protein
MVLLIKSIGSIADPMIFYFNNMKKVVVYVDGSNLYFSIKKKFGCKIDIEKFCKKLTYNNSLVKIKYYIASVGQLSHPDMHANQQRFFGKLKKVNNLKITFGRLEKRKRDGEVYFIEKATDVNLALDLVLDAQANEYDMAFLVSNDGDFSGAVDAAINRFEKEVVYVAIGNNKMISHHLKSVASRTFMIDKDFVNDVKLVKE